MSSWRDYQDSLYSLINNKFAVSLVVPKLTLKTVLYYVATLGDTFQENRSLVFNYLNPKKISAKESFTQYLT